jgi:hypothetical protein
LAISVLGQGFGQRIELIGADPPVAPGDLLRAANAKALARLNRLDVVRSFEQRLVGTRVEPGIAATQLLKV